MLLKPATLVVLFLVSLAASAEPTDEILGVNPDFSKVEAPAVVSGQSWDATQLTFAGEFAGYEDKFFEAFDDRYIVMGLRPEFEPDYFSVTVSVRPSRGPQSLNPLLTRTTYFRNVGDRELLTFSEDAIFGPFDLAEGMARIIRIDTYHSVD